MSYKTILVYADMDAGAAERFRIAATIAARFDAHLIGLHVVRMAMLPAFVAAEAPAAFAEAQQNMWRRRAEESGRRFSAAVEAAGVTSSEMRVVEDRVGDVLGEAVRAARVADLIVAPQANAEEGDAALEQIAEKLVMDSGRPVLVSPYSDGVKTVANHPIVMWNSSRESTRAAFDALPLLKAADTVTILCVDPDKSIETGEGPLPGADLAQALARHGVTVDTQMAYSRNGDIGAMMLNHVSDLGGDLIVMGAYGHPRLHELFFGGATRTIFKTMTTPVLASH